MATELQQSGEVGRTLLYDEVGGRQVTAVNPTRPRTPGHCLAFALLALASSAILLGIVLGTDRSQLRSALRASVTLDEAAPGPEPRPRWSSRSSSAPLRSLGRSSQKIYVVRHGDKYNSYPTCRPTQDPFGDDVCYSPGTMGINPPLTGCGIEQAEKLGARLIEDAEKAGGLANIVVSPYLRTLQTALPTARKAGLPLHVEYLVSEARQPDGPFRPFNVEAGPNATAQMAEAEKLWDLEYGSPPIPVPENDTLYTTRVEKMAKVLTKRFPPSTGNLAIFTHATTSFSVAYGLCGKELNGEDGLEKWVNQQEAIAPTGVIAVTIENGKCKEISQTDNSVWKSLGCGKTEPFKCEYENFPAWYWSDPKGKGPGKCH